MASASLFNYYEMKQQQEQEAKKRAEAVKVTAPFNDLSRERFEYLQTLIKQGKLDPKVLMSEGYKNKEV